MECCNLCLDVFKVPRAAASAVAFGIGLFSGKGTLGPGQHHAFSVVSDSRASDILLRFYDTCATYRVCVSFFLFNYVSG